MTTQHRSHHIVERVGARGMHLCVTSDRYVVPDAEDDAKRYLELFKQIKGPVVGISDFSAIRSLEPGVRTVWGKIMADHGGDYKALHALLPDGAIGKIGGMAVTAWGMMVGVPIRCYGDRGKWATAAAADGVEVPPRRTA